MPADPTWSKADLRRMQTGLDQAKQAAFDRISWTSTDSYRERVNAELASNAVTLVRAYLRWLIQCAENNPRIEAEARAATRLLARLDVEPLPVDLLTMPRIMLLCEIVIEPREIADAPTAPLDVPLYQSDPERDARTIATNLADVVARGVVEIRRAGADAFGTDTPWSDVDGLVSWRVWARPAAERKQCVAAWDRCTTDAEKLRVNARPLDVLWSDACADEPLPSVMDLRGVPESHGMPIEGWRDALAEAIRKAARGLVIVVDCEPWALARLLPQRVGEST